MKQLRTILVPTGILNLDSGVGLRVGFVDHLSADLLGQNLHKQRFHTLEFVTGQTEHVNLYGAAAQHSLTSYRVL